MPRSISTKIPEDTYFRLRSWMAEQRILRLGEAIERLIDIAEKGGENLEHIGSLTNFRRR